MELYIVTGASRGLGLALANHASAQPDARVLAISRAGQPADCPPWRDVRADLGTPAGQARAAQAIASALEAEQWQRAVLINNAGTIDPLGVIGHLDAMSVQRSIAVNLTAAIVLTNAFVAGSANVHERRVINISSGAGRNPLAGAGVYCVGKAGMDMAARVAALEAERAGIRIAFTSLAPGIIDTDMQVAARSASEAQFPEASRFRTFKSQNQLKSADEVAQTIIALERAGKMPVGIADLRELARE